MTSPALETDADFESAMSEAQQLIGTAPPADSAEAQRLHRRLAQIAEFHEALPPERQTANLGRLTALDKALRAFGKQWPAPQGDHPWAPMVGGDVDPTHQH